MGEPVCVVDTAGGKVVPLLEGTGEDEGSGGLLKVYAVDVALDVALEPGWLEPVNVENSVGVLLLKEKAGRIT